METFTLDNREFSLVNSGDLELFFIGVGSAFSKEHYQTNLLVIKGNDHLLIDCGTRCPQAFHELGTPIGEVKNFLITHSHADHIGGLEEIALTGRYANKRKPVMIINETYQHILWDMSLRGGVGYNEEDGCQVLIFDDFFDIIRPEIMPDFPRETLGAKVGNIDIKMVRTKHIPDSSKNWMSSFWSCGVIIDDRILFTSDTRFDYDLIDHYEKLFKFDAIFHDGQFFTGGVHASLEELSGLQADFKSKIFISHYGDNWKEHFDKVQEFGFAGLAKQHVYYNFDK